VYEVVVKLKDKLALDCHPTLQEAREAVQDMLEEENIPLLIRPIVIDSDSGVAVTPENMNYYDLQSEWVKNHIKQMEEI
jgi:hypothetical protein